MKDLLIQQQALLRNILINKDKMEEWVKIILIEENEEMFDEIKYELINDGIEMLTELIIGDKPNLTDMMNKYGLLIYNMEKREEYRKCSEIYGDVIEISTLLFKNQDVNVQDTLDNTIKTYRENDRG